MPLCSTPTSGADGRAPATLARRTQWRALPLPPLVPSLARGSRAARRGARASYASRAITRARHRERCCRRGLFRFLRAPSRRRPIAARVYDRSRDMPRAHPPHIFAASNSNTLRCQQIGHPRDLRRWMHEFFYLR